jgi:RNA polymerase sigma-70 factor (ECF subfamily)
MSSSDVPAADPLFGVTSADVASARLPPDALDDLPDADLLAQHLDGDRRAFSVLVARHRDRLWAVALRTLGNPHDAADAVQDALLSAYRSASTFRGDAAVTTWLHRIVVNACLDRVRQARARPTIPLADDTSSSAASGALAQAASLAHPRPDSREAALDLWAALRRIPVEQAAAVVLVDACGWSVAEAADILECAEGTVKSRCARARAKLATLLGEGGTERNRAPLAGVEERRTDDLGGAV